MSTVRASNLIFLFLSGLLAQTQLGRRFRHHLICLLLHQPDRLSPRKCSSLCCSFFSLPSAKSRGQIMTLCDVAVWQNYDAPPSPCQFPAAECPSGTSERCVWTACLCECWGHNSLSAYIHKSLALPHLLLRNIIRMRDAQWCVAHCLSSPRVENTRRFDNALLLPEAPTEKSEKHCDLCCKHITVKPAK